MSLILIDSQENTRIYENSRYKSKNFKMLKIDIFEHFVLSNVDILRKIKNKKIKSISMNYFIFLKKKHKLRKIITSIMKFG